MRGAGIKMKVLVVGANGKVGKFLVKQLQDSKKHTVRAMVRKQEQLDVFEKNGIETCLADLEGTVSEIEEVLKGVDAIVFSAGAGGASIDKTLLIDLDGAVKTMEAAKNVGVKRFVLISTFQAHRREHWSKQLKSYYVAKHYADRMLEQMGLTYTIIRPGSLTNDPGTNHVQASVDLSYGTIPREDVARVVIASLDNEKTYNHGFDVTSGTLSIVEALDSL